jgi:adenylate cyclase
LAIALKGQSSSAGVVKVPHSTKFDAEKVKQQLGISVRAWDEHMYEMKQLSQRKVTKLKQQYFDAVFNNTSLSIADQDDSIIQFYRNVATQAQSNPTTNKAETKTEPNGRAMSKVMSMFNGQGRGQNSAQPKTPPMVCCAVSLSLLTMNVVP